MRVDWFEISGPFNPTGISDTASRRKIFSCYPKVPAEELRCAEEIVSQLASRAFRRPLSEQDLAERMAYYQDGRANGGDFEQGEGAPWTHPGPTPKGHQDLGGVATPGRRGRRGQMAMRVR